MARHSRSRRTGSSAGAAASAAASGPRSTCPSGSATLLSVGGNWIDVRTGTAGAAKSCACGRCTAARVAAARADDEPVPRADGHDDRDCRACACRADRRLRADSVRRAGGSCGHGAARRLARHARRHRRTPRSERREDDFGIEPGAWRVALGPAIGGCCYEVEADIGAPSSNALGCHAAMPGSRVGDARPARLRQPIGTSWRGPGCAGDDRRHRPVHGSCATASTFPTARSGGRAGRQVEPDRVGSRSRRPRRLKLHLRSIRRGLIRLSALGVY